MRRGRWVALGVVFVSATVFVASGGWDFVNDAERVEAFFTQRGALGPLVFVVSMWALQPAGVPGAVFMLPAAVVWPLPTAMALSWVGNMGASTIAFATARWLAHDWAQARLPRRIRAWDTRFAGGTQLQVTWQVTLLRLVTGQLTPADWLLGVSTVSVRAFLLGTAIGIIPGIVLITTVGGGLLDLFADRRARWLALAILVVVVGVRQWRRRRGAAFSPDRERWNGADAPQ